MNLFKNMYLFIFKCMYVCLFTKFFVFFCNIIASYNQLVILLWDLKLASLANSGIFSEIKMHRPCLAK